MATVGSFGKVVFEVSANVVRTFDNFTRQRDYSYADHDTVTGKPTSEFTGLKLDKISFRIQLLANLGVDPDAEVEKLAEMGESGDAHQLLIGDKVIGHFTIRSTNEAMKHWVKGNRYTEVEITIAEHVPQDSGPGAESKYRDADRRGVAY